MAGKCPSCGGPLVDEPGNDVYVCTVCGDLFARDKLVHEGIVPKHEDDVTDELKEDSEPYGKVSDYETECTLSRLRRLQWIVMIILWLVIIGVGASVSYRYFKKSHEMGLKENPLEGTLMSGGQNLLTEEYLEEEYKIFYYQEDYSQRGQAVLVFMGFGVFTVYIIMAVIGSIVKARVTGVPLNKASFYKVLGILIIIDMFILVMGMWGLQEDGLPPGKASYSVYEMEFLGKYDQKVGKKRKYYISYMENNALKEKSVKSTEYALYPNNTCTIYVAEAKRGGKTRVFHTYRADAYKLP